jgi:hypothetical protein
MITGFSEKVLQLLAMVAETDEVRTNLDLPLYDYQLQIAVVQKILLKTLPE